MRRPAVRKKVPDELTRETLGAFVRSFVTIADDRDFDEWCRALIRVMRHLIEIQNAVSRSPELLLRVTEGGKRMSVEILRLHNDMQVEPIEWSGWLLRGQGKDWLVVLENMLMRVIRRLLKPERIRERILRAQSDGSPTPKADVPATTGMAPRRKPDLDLRSHSLRPRRPHPPSRDGDDGPRGEDGG